MAAVLLCVRPLPTSGPLPRQLSPCSWPGWCPDSPDRAGRVPPWGLPGCVWRTWPPPEQADMVAGPALWGAGLGPPPRAEGRAPRLPLLWAPRLPDRPGWRLPPLTKLPFWYFDSEMAARLLPWCPSPSPPCKVLLFYGYFNLSNCRGWVASGDVLLRITWPFIFDCGWSAVSVRSCSTAWWQCGSCPRKMAKFNKEKGRDMCTHGGDTNRHLDCHHWWEPSNQLSCLQHTSATCIPTNCILR